MTRRDDDQKALDSTFFFNQVIHAKADMYIKAINTAIGRVADLFMLHVLMIYIHNVVSSLCVAELLQLVNDLNPPARSHYFPSPSYLLFNGKLCEMTTTPSGGLQTNYGRKKWSYPKTWKLERFRKKKSDLKLI